MEKLPKILNLLLVVLFCLVILALPLFSKLQTGRSVSLYENRTLAQPPVFSQAALVDGSYFAGWESYYKDHVFRRDDWLRGQVAYEKYILGRNVINEVVLLPDLLLPKINYLPLTTDLELKCAEMAQSLAQIDALLAAWGGQFLYVGIPEQYSAFYDRYPSYLFNNRQNLLDLQREFFAALQTCGVQALNMRQVFQAQGGLEPYYLKTDHHYSFAGAYETYLAICAQAQVLGLDIPVLTAEALNFADLPQQFIGSRSRKIYQSTPVRDSLAVYSLVEPIPFRRYDNGVLQESSVFALPGDGEGIVEYTVYMGGDIAETVIQTNRPGLPKLLIFGDSFTNPLETLLYTGFDEMRSLDLRHYQEQGILQYIADYQPDLVICVRDDNYFLSLAGNGEIRW